MKSLFRIILALLVVMGISVSAQAQINWGEGGSGEWDGGTDINITPGTGTGHVTSLQLSASRLLLSGGETAQLVAIVNADAANKKVTWSVVDATIATVSGNGLVKALTTGQTVVTATTVDGGLKAQCLVTVKNNALVYVERIELDKTERTMYVGETALLKPTVYPTNASNKQVAWEVEQCQDRYIPCTITQEGFATALKPGKITYVVRPQDGADVATKVLITVKDKPVSSISLPSTISLNINEMKTLNPEVTPGLMQPMFQWTTADPSIAYVNASGRITGRKAGETTVTATAIDGTGKSCSARVVVSGNKAKWGYSGWVLERGENVHPWTARYYNEAEVSEIGKDRNGKAWYELGFDDSSWRYGYGPMVFYGWEGYEGNGQWNEPHSPMFLRQEFYIADVEGYDFNFYGGILCGDGTVYLNGQKINVTDGMAQLDRSLLNIGGMNVIAMAIYVTLGHCTPNMDFGIHYEASVPVTRIILSDKQLTLPQCTTHKLTAVIKPNEATRPNLQWTSDCPTVASVDEWGNVTTMGEGVANITATSTDGSNISASCRVTVTNMKYDDVWIKPLGRNQRWTAKYKYCRSGETLYDNGPANDQNGRAWTSTQYDDSSWESIVGPIGHEVGDYYETYWPDNDSRYYLREKFTITNLSEYKDPRILVRHDDGVRVWLNGNLIRDTEDCIMDDWLDMSGVTLQTGTNTICIQVTEGYGGAYIDYGIVGSKWVEVKPVTGVRIDKQELTLKIRERQKLTASLLPSDAYYQEVRWESSNPRIATVDREGNVRAVAPGKVVITVYNTHGKRYEAQCQVTVEEGGVAAGSLPDVNFEFNYNAFDYDEETHRIPNHTSAKLADYNLLLTENLPVYDAAEGSLDIQSICCGWIDRWERESRESGNYFHRSDQDDMTIICKVAPRFNGTASDFISNRAGGYNYMFRIGDNGRFFLHTDIGYKDERALPLEEHEEQILAVRVNGSENCIMLDNLTTGEFMQVNDVAWGGGDNAFTFFYNDGGEYYTGKFFWVYYSKELLTDEELQCVTDYNETPTSTLGDVNGDGKIDRNDVSAISNYILDLPQNRFNKIAADVNRDGRISIADISHLTKMIKQP